MTENLPPISVVVIGRNEGQRLVRCLKSVRAADYPPDRIELIYVDSDSSDGSAAAAEELGARVICIQPDRPCAAATRNAGLHAASHELIQFLDGDTILNPLWLKQSFAALDDPDIACVFGQVEEVAPTATIYNFWAHHDWYVRPGPAEACGGIAMFRRDVLVNVGGYDSSLIAGEEQDLSFRMIHNQGVAIVCLDYPMALHDINMTRFGQYWRRCFRSGYAYAQVGARYPGLRSWRRTCYRNMMHAVVALGAVALSLMLWSIWPLASWIALLVLAVARNAIRCRPRVSSTGRAILYSVHHYLSKAPTVAGHLDCYFRDLTGASHRRLIERGG